MTDKPARLVFRPASRLLSPKDFERVYALRRRVGDGLFTVNIAPNSLGHARLGLSVSKKAVGDAVDRNRVKRQVREAFRLALPTLPPFDLVVGARNAASTATGAALRASLEAHWERIRGLIVTPEVQ